MLEGKTLIIPAGWAGCAVKKDKNPADVPGAGGGNVLYVVHRNRDGLTADFAVINTGDGSQYHPVTVEDSPDPLYKPALVFRDIPWGKITDSSLWLVLMKIQVTPSDLATVDVVYESILPFLNEKTLAATVCDNMETTSSTGTSHVVLPWEPLARGSAGSLVEDVIKACSFAMLSEGMGEGKILLIDLLCRWTIAKMMHHDLTQMTDMSGSDIHMCHHTLKQLAGHGATHMSRGGVMSSGGLKALQSFIDKTRALLTDMKRSSPMAQSNPKPLRAPEKYDGYMCSDT
ncbi:hypothetical protein SARC_09967 [Sphaeroforma arctica JP610]|uniref:Uncharacterized protein n=1 Tax=Sphaeroforma arctica JP610 TaxID=667725 RepID=A0A0L0FLC8_9EUKA|nr:hypothetical protein SARC_09967 [Sphaeroforma arctica JP610]KNC77574.1 hypothetical protein SARC_09967 [Sphaeroforma arctica JP610]|eukprot:XP_014151476.1 hypothetical protein SARC_09967 [Sphaeroforma arctica JP610]